MTSSKVAKLLAAVLSGVLPLCVMAEGMTSYGTQTIIDGDAGSNAQGLLGVNMAAGDSNLQSNAAAIVINDGNGQAVALTSTMQVIDTGQFSLPDVAITKIDGNAFNNAAGLIAINQSAGAANVQANNIAIAIGLGAEVTADADLAQSISGVTLPVVANGPVREATVADTAFSGAHGIVQVNQSAGIANATGNSFALRVQLGAPQ